MNRKYFIYLLLLGAVLARFAVAFWTAPEARPPVNTDDREYYELGRSFALDGVLSEPFTAWEPSAHRGFLYPAYLGLFSGSAPGGWNRARAAVLAASAALVLLLAAAGAEAGLGPLPLLFFLFSGAANFASSVYIEAFYSLCLLLCAALAARWAASPGVKESAALGLALAVSVSCRSALVFLPLALAAWGCARLRAPGRALAALLLCGYLPLAGWTARNYHIFGRLIPLEDGAAAGVIYTASAGEDLGLTMDEILARFRAERPDLAGLGRAETIEALKTQARRNISGRPWAYLAGTARRAALSAKMAAVQAGWLALAGLAAAFWFARRERGFQALLLFAGYFLGVHSFMSVSERYFVPLVPVLCLAAAKCCARSGLFQPVRRAGLAAGAAFSGLAALWLLGSAGLVREALSMRGAPAGLHGRALRLMTPAGGCRSGELLAGALARPPANPATLSKLYSDAAVAAYLCSGDRKAALEFSSKALAADPENAAARQTSAALGKK